MSKTLDAIYGLALLMPESWRTSRLSQRYKSKHGPGQIVEKCLSDECRSTLQKLKSDDLINLRPDLVYIDDERQRQKDEFSQLKLDFDKLIKN